MLSLLLLFSFVVCLVGQELSQQETCINLSGENICYNNDCRDSHEHCGYWSNQGECEANPGYMYRLCRKSCNACDIDVFNPDVIESLEKTYGDHDRDRYGVMQIIDDQHADKIHAVLKDMEKYMDGMRNHEGSSEEIRDMMESCQNLHASCAFWASLNECQKNPEYMRITCAPVCKSCDRLAMQKRCPLDPNAPDAWHAGDLEKLFHKLVTDPAYAQYSPKALSRPYYAPGDNKEDADYVLGPWVVLLENFLSQEEADRLIELGHTQGYAVSAETGQTNPDGTMSPNVSQRRTSANAWCTKACYEDAMARGVSDRIADLTDTPETNQEYLQLLRYEVGQLYAMHHDYIGNHIERQPGVRILTVFLYLNDVLAGGGTKFNGLNVTVTPKRGHALLWPSVLDDDPNKIDPRTRHEALAVEAGIKYAANAWIHMRDFKTPMENNCQ